jgi:hypothetical protein
VTFVCVLCTLRTHISRSIQFATSLTTVYGRSLKALATIRGLIDAGTPTAGIVWAFPERATCTDWCAGDETVRQRVAKVAERFGIRVVPMTEVRSASALVNLICVLSCVAP